MSNQIHSIVFRQKTIECMWFVTAVAQRMKYALVHLRTQHLSGAWEFWKTRSIIWKHWWFRANSLAKHLLWEVWIFVSARECHSEQQSLPGESICRFQRCRTPGFGQSDAVFDLFIETRFMHLITSYTIFKTFLAFYYQNNLTLCQKYHKFRLSSIFADAWQVVPFDVRY